MATRTTSIAVSAIIEVDVGDDLTPFIEAANVIVTKNCTHADFTVTDLEIIERWLAAHFYAMYKARASEERAGQVSARYQSKVDLGFDLSHYGQMAMRLDWSGALSTLNQQSKKGGAIPVSVTSLGTEKEDLED